ncbi:hypothetical protein ACH0CG_10985 [Microbacterium sp. 179-I 1D1 NHS]|uniref:hypothetical protein n=1 Tax=Microbacterium sp. 179-I 1D1 NHS TaxID=3374298 RepID=UPI00387A586F
MTLLPARLRAAGIAALVAVGSVVLLSACAPGTAPGAGGSSHTPQASATTGPAPAQIDPDDVTCENMLSPDTVETFGSTGWTVREDPFVILDLELPKGIACTWGDFSSPTNDDLILFGWSPISEADASAAEAALEAEGWLRKDDPRGTMITEDPSSALRLDDQGYGMTYLFRNGWVEVSDTRQGLDLIDLG